VETVDNGSAQESRQVTYAFGQLIWRQISIPLLIKIFIDHLTRKVDFLESKISHLCQKHVEICIMLCAELEKKKVNEQTLRQENIELNK